MEKQEQIQIFKAHLDGATALFTNYLHEIFQNKDNLYWAAEDWDQIKGFHIAYDSDYLAIYIASWDAYMDECEEQKETSFFLELYNEKNGLDEDKDFMPEALSGIEIDLSLYDLLEEWLISCSKNALPADFSIPCFVGDMDSAYYTNILTGEKGDHIYVLDILDPDAVDNETELDSRFVEFENRRGKFALQNPEGEMISEFIYDYVIDFEGDFAQVAIDGEEGSIDKKGVFTKKA